MTLALRDKGKLGFIDEHVQSISTKVNWLDCGKTVMQLSFHGSVVWLQLN